MHRLPLQLFATLGALLALAAPARAQLDLGASGPWFKARASAVDIKIIGGRKAEPTASPWQVALMDADMSVAAGVFCGGSLIGSRWVLTAHHCFVDEQTCLTKYTKNKVWVVHGTVDLAVKPPRLAGIRSIHGRRPAFDCLGKGNDLALVELDEPLSDITPMRLATGADEQALLAGPLQSLRTTGWGWTQENGKLNQFLMEVEVPLVTREKCRSLLAPDIDVPADAMCAGDLGKDACTFDSGGPLFRRGSGAEAVQFGVVSFGSGCGRRDKPGVYTRVASHLSWIDATIKTAQACTPEKVNKGIC